MFSYGLKAAAWADFFRRCRRWIGREGGVWCVAHGASGRGFGNRSCAVPMLMPNTSAMPPRSQPAATMRPSGAAVTPRPRRPGALAPNSGGGRWRCRPGRCGASRRARCPRRATTRRFPTEDRGGADDGSVGRRGEAGYQLVERRQQRQDAAPQFSRRVVERAADRCQLQFQRLEPAPGLGERQLTGFLAMGANLLALTALYTGWWESCFGAAGYRSRRSPRLNCAARKGRRRYTYCLCYGWMAGLSRQEVRQV